MSALDEIKSRAHVDIDQLDPKTAQQLGPFCDMSESRAQKREGRGGSSGTY